jgi:predicted HNH restriction endonuclease
MKTNMTWKDFVLREVENYCKEAGTRTFSLKSLLDSKLELFNAFRPENFHVEAKIRQQLQFLRNEEKITFVDNSGHYTLRTVLLLPDEIEETKSIDLTREEPEKREYIIETYVRKVAWANMAKQKFGDMCLYDKCTNTFLRQDGSRYVEVHHIVPLCKGGEDGIWNLTVLCSHHHRMAHFGDTSTRIKMENDLLRETRGRI